MKSVQKVLGELETFGHSTLHLLSPLASPAFADQVSHANSLIAKMESTPGGNFLEEAKLAKKNMSNCMGLLKANAKSAARLGKYCAGQLTVAAC